MVALKSFSVIPFLSYFASRAIVSKHDSVGSPIPFPSFIEESLFKIAFNKRYSWDFWLKSS